MAKNFKLSPGEIVELLPPMGGCLATDKITVDGMPVDYMYRDEPANEMDSGWRFFSGTEDDEYMRDSANSGVYSLNTIANYDPAIIEYIHLPPGTELERVMGSNHFKAV